MGVWLPDGDELKARLEEICTDYNNTAQESRVIGGDHIEYLSPEDAWLKYRERDSSGAIVEPQKLPKELEYMLCEQQQEVDDHKERDLPIRRAIPLPQS